MSGEEEEEGAGEAHDELAVKLRDVGLDAVYWKQKLRKVLSISNTQALPDIDRQEFRKLDPHFRQGWEKRAFYKMIGIYVGDGDSETTGLAPEIQNTNLLPSVRVIQEPPQEMGTSDSREHGPDKDILQNASGGLALQGIYLSGKLEDALEKRGQLLTIPQTFGLVDPVHKPMTKQREFTSLSAESVFEKTMEFMGFSSAISEKGHHPALGRGPFSKISGKSWIVKDTKQAHSYLSRTEFMYLPLASGNLQMKQLRLSEAALKALQNIENRMGTWTKDLESEELKRMSRNFFHKFGCHANQGPLELGGIFWRKASAEGFSSDQQEIKRLLSESLEPNIGVDCDSRTTHQTDRGAAMTTEGAAMTTEGAAMTTEGAASGSGDHSPALTSVVQMTVTTTGGDTNVHDLSQWKSALTSNSGTWSLIDRGNCFIPVWDIVLSNHKRDFQDYLKLSSYLVTAYTSLTINSPEDHFAVRIVESQSIMQDVKQCQECDHEDQLERLGNLKEKLYKATKSNRSWIDACLSHPVLQQFLSRVVSKHTHPCDKTKRIQMKTRQLLELSVYAVENFPQRSSIMQWVYGCEREPVLHAEINDLTKALTETKRRIQEATDADTSSDAAHIEAKLKGTDDITFSLNSLLLCLRAMERLEEELLFISTAAASGFGAEERMFHRLLDCEDVERLQHQVHTAYSEYSALRSHSTSQAQAYILLHGLTTSAQSTGWSPESKEEQLTFMTSHLHGTIRTEVSNVLQVHGRSPIIWGQLEESLKSLVAGTLNVALASPQNPGTESETKTKAFLNLIERLGLQKYFPRNMQTEAVCVVNKTSTLTKPPITEQELASHYLQKCMMIDYRARYVRVQAENKNNETTYNGENSNIANTNHVPESTATNRTALVQNFLHNRDAKSSGKDTFNSRHGPISDTRTHIHPMDLQMAIFHCGDNFTRQYIYTKLSHCQFALPLLVPNPCTSRIEFPIWAFRQIEKSWTCRDASTKTQQTKTCAIVDADTPVVSFIRLGTSSTSKSEMLNSLLSKQKNEVFFHRHCRGGNRESLLMEGVTEIAWYCPGGRDDDVFNDCVAFTNLHGDAREHSQQVQFLLQISSINVILIADCDCDEKVEKIIYECLMSSTPLVCLCTDQEVIVDKKSGTNVRIAVKNRNEAELMDELKSSLKSLLACPGQTLSIDACSDIARQHSFSVDEDDEDCKQGKANADSLLNALNVEPLSNMKETFLPLQGKFWRGWCKKDKELTRLTVTEQQSLEMHKDSILTEKQSIRTEQLGKAFPLNNVMKLLVETLQHQADTVKQYFMHWIKMYLENLSTDPISQLQQQYHQAWREIIESKKTGNDELQRKQAAELEQLSLELDACSFGIDHLVRELGQIYEGSQELDAADERAAPLPGIAAELMISGFPLELMDGDAAHVPLTWIGSVLDKVSEKLGNRRIFVLSILGLQSSGKSTLLNAMFGLQFPVSAGRCTRGAYMQLVKVEAEFSQELGFDFVLVVDTEGLRAPELSNAKTTRDNELATFVIGLGNVTVINIMGENPSEMQDILQIAVQAFLRMRQVNLSPSCVFVHQNVAAVTAQDKNTEARRRVKQRLDEMTRVAAEQEQCQVEAFDDVIRFNVETDIRYFAQLWEGNPPMAPPNPGYCQDVKELRKMLLSFAKDKCNILTISDFRARIEDLWTAVLTENFVFSFKNTLEIAAYNKLEEMYGKWTWRLRSHLIQEENKQYNNIYSTDTKSNLTRSDIEKTIPTIYNEIRKEIETYFSREEDAELLSQWKSRFLKRFEAIKDDLVTDTHRKCADLINQKEERNRLDVNRSHYEDQLMNKSKDLASKLRNMTVTDDQLDGEFDQMWQQWTDEVKNSIVPPKTVHYINQIQSALAARFSSENDYSSILMEMKKELFVVCPERHIVIKRQGAWKKVKQLILPSYSRESEIAANIAEEAKNKSRDVIKRLEKQRLGYSETNIHEVIQAVLTAVDAGSEHNVELGLTNRYKLDLAKHILTEAEERFKKLESDFQKANDPLVYFSSKKDEYFNSFKIRYNGATKTTMFAYTVCGKLKPAIHQAVRDKVCLDIADKMKSDHPAFNGNRSNLENHILIHLAEREKFQEFKKYIKNAKQYFEKYITHCVEEYCSAEQNKRIRDMFQSCLELYKGEVFKAITKATTAVQENQGDASSWLNDFSKELGNNIQFPRYSLFGADYQDVEDFAFFRDELTKAMGTVVVQLQEQYSKASLKDFDEARNKPQDLLLDQMSGCWEQCPFCNAICTNTMSDHEEDHSVPIHRPQAVIGCQWYKTNHLVTDICTSLVSSTNLLVLSDDNKIPYRDYRRAGSNYAKWRITPDLTVQPYWKWFVCRFKSEHENLYKAQFSGLGTIPEGWEKITKKAAIGSLSNKKSQH